MNIGCGATPTEGWCNFDNSLTVRIANHSILLWALAKFGLIAKDQRAFALAVRRAGIQFADATRHLPLPDESVCVIYSSHMLEHLGQADARVALAEFRRVLKPGGVLRLAVPDIRQIVETYLASGDADQLMAKSLLGRERPRGIAGYFRASLIGDRSHRWMYDGPSLIRLVESIGFVDAVELAAGRTTISSPGRLDLHERADESVYIEAHRR